MIETGVVESIKSMSLGPRDVLVIRASAPWTPEQRDLVHRQVADLLASAGLANKVMVVPYGLNLEVLRVEPDDCAEWLRDNRDGIRDALREALA